MDQTSLLKNRKEFCEKSKPRTKKNRDKERNAFDSINALYEGCEKKWNISNKVSKY